VHDNRNKKKNTDSSAEFHQNQLDLSVFFIYWLVFAQPHPPNKPRFHIFRLGSSVVTFVFLGDQLKQFPELFHSPRRF
ncbi:hypothetical protein, partial [Streptococcus suis]|uniref:hypothetical protein n=1 Tax=Streptococcus suis TaxID=1307 RepID=UPI001EE6B720